MLPFATEAQIKKAIKESVNSGSTPSPQPVDPINDFEGLRTLLTEICENVPEPGSIDRTFEFDYVNPKDDYGFATMDLLESEVFRQLPYNFVSTVFDSGGKLFMNLQGGMTNGSPDVLIIGPLNITLQMELDPETGDGHVLCNYVCSMWEQDECYMFTANPQYVIGTIRLRY